LRNKAIRLEPRPLPTAFSSFVIDNEPTKAKGDLTHNTYPFFAGTMALSQEFTLDKLDAKARYLLTLPAAETVLAEVTVNGIKLPTLFCKPWEADITKALKFGKNSITIRLTNSLRNLMGPHHNKGAEFSEVGPDTFSTSGIYWPTPKGYEDPQWFDNRLIGKAKLWTDDYFVIPFGLLEAPKISKIY
jgi:hypothetical protein